MTPNPKIAIIGLGYVGLPLAVALAEHYHVVGFDINHKRIDELRKGQDSTLEVEPQQLHKVLMPDAVALGNSSAGFYPSHAVGDISSAHVYIVTVPTPIDKYNRPDLTPMIKASETVARILSPGDVVVYESTVYPGVTEEEMVPILEASGLTYNQDFFVGYSPERINPGDKEHTISKIKKVTSGSTPEAAEYIDSLYRSIITVGTHKAGSIKVAEAAKVIENAQRDINIAFVNELAKIFHHLGIDTQEVLEAAGTKWNFLPFRPGLVGGHCIGVDPYYLAQKAQEAGYHPEIILAGRRLNDGMGKYVATEVIKHMMRKNIPVMGGKALILGITFKEDCPDVRNTRVVDIYQELKAFDMDVDIHDPWADATEVHHEYGISLLPKDQLQPDTYGAIIVAVGHQDFKQLDIRTAPDRVVYDVKAVLEKEVVDGRL